MLFIIIICIIEYPITEYTYIAFMIIFTANLQPKTQALNFAEQTLLIKHQLEYFTKVHTKYMPYLNASILVLSKILVFISSPKQHSKYIACLWDYSE